MKKYNILTGRMKAWSVVTALALTVCDLLMARYLPARWGMTGTIVSVVLVNAAAVLGLAYGLRCMTDVPLEQLYRSLGDYLDGTADEIDWDVCAREDAVGAVAERTQELIEQIETWTQTAGENAARQTDQQVRRSIADEICRSALPQVLPDIPSRSYFEVDGLVDGGQVGTCQFYDYFFIDPGLLCVVIGHIPGEGVAESVYMVTAQTMIRSRLRQGRSLEETMSDVNAQLYDLGSAFALHALVGTLSTADGRFTYVNAGQAEVMCMRSADRYAPVESPDYTPLGMNEHVTYRSMELRLRQGDRLFLYTSGLNTLKMADGTAYGEQQLRADLNVSRGREMDGEQLLRFMQDQAICACDGQSNTGFAMLTLLYCKGDKELAHCDVPAKAEYAAEVLEFLKKQFEDNGIDRRHYAREAVIVDEVFALCCRKAAAGSRIMVECGIAPDAQMVNIRVTAVLGGANPMQAEQMELEQNAVRFIREHADYVTFKPGSEWDTLTIVCFLA